MKITSISRKLLTRVLSVYFILTISVTGVQIIAEYFNTKSHINSELLTLQKTISGSLTRAVWELNTKQAVDISEGLIAIPLIKGITVTDEANDIITQLGEVLTLPAQTSQEAYSEHQSISSLSEGLFGHSFPLIFEFSGRTTTVGTVTLLSSNDVIFSRIEVGIYFLIGNAIVKTAFLVFLFSLAFTKLLTEPLQELTDQMKQLDLHDPEASKFHSMNNERDELNILEDAYNNLIDELIEFKDKLALSQRETNSANDKLDEQNLLLEQEVAKKTSTLSSTLLRMEVQQKEMLKQQHQLEAENSRRRKTESTLITTNKDLKSSIIELSKAQDRLLEAEKMSSLGQLSAEVSHEINTPIGISITSTSYLSDVINKLQQDINEKKLSKRTIDSFIVNAQQSIDLLLNNLQRAAELITSFKQVAVDQTNDKVRLINVAKYLDEIIQSIHPKLKKTTHCIKVHCDPHIEIYTHPGAIAQIIINLIINSIAHGFPNINRGEMTIDISMVQQRLIILYSDNGVGVNEQQLEKLFDPFYTTQANKGGTGLGTHIIKNLIVDTLNGSIDASSKENEGLSYSMTFPDMRYS
ncbi:sensor histidine kinase [Colwellia psychrerythraea]|uniref:histidine kinase n=1 Tax=Colwellia psychrerythraea TaxID=28229 RepID=A0A099KM45_COLPS|nr:HAMP domain-containing sensor histidine kinase [Colwellia psychrerythraea]KGJ91839.1 integral membrane sensor signal transduction histidine kinase [Colwellia psychrerythraea]